METEVLHLLTGVNRVKEVINALDDMLMSDGGQSKKLLIMSIHRTKRQFVDLFKANIVSYCLTVFRKVTE